MFIKKYYHWLHGKWPSGLVESLPEVNEGGTTNIKGVRIVGDLSGVPLLKFSADTGAKAVHEILVEEDFKKSRNNEEGVLDLAIIGSGVSGLSAALEAKKAGFKFRIFDAVQPFSTIKGFPKGKPIYTYPKEMVPAGDVQLKADVKEGLLDELKQLQEEGGIEVEQFRISHIERKGDSIQLLDGKGQVFEKALRVIVAIGKSGNYRKLGVEGESLDKVYNRLHDPKEYSKQKVLVVGGGDSALEASIALVEAGADVTLNYRKKEFSRPKPDNVDKLKAFEMGQGKGSLRLMMASNVKEVTLSSVNLLKQDGSLEVLENDVVFMLIGREAPLDFFRRSKINIAGEWGAKAWTTLIAFMLFSIWMYHWKSSGNIVNSFFSQNHWFPFNLSYSNPKTLIGAFVNSLPDPGFYYSIAYCLCVVVFGFRRIKRRNTPYIKIQTYTLMTVQLVPLFLLPYIIFPWMGANGVFTGGGLGQWFGDTFFPNASYWRSFGFLLAWPLFIWNVFTPDPVWGWLVLSLIQTFVIIPLIVWRWGKGAYCGWLCSCGALAETLGDAHRHKMPHGPKWNKLNMVGQVILLFSFILLALRILSWIYPESGLEYYYTGLLSKFAVFNYKYLVDLWLAGIIGVAFYFHFSGRIWCRFACPLAALMHIYARFSRYRIFAEKSKCISCNGCTTVCHQGIDIMNFANKGLPMEDPECVRCSACVDVCPTDVLSFGRLDGKGEIVKDKISARRQ